MSVRKASMWAAVLCIVSTVFVVGRARADVANTVRLDDLSSVVSLSGVALSPDARSVALIATRADFIDNRLVSSLWLVNTRSGERRGLAEGRPNVSSPRWSPEGDRLAWLDSSQDGKSQIYVLELSRPDAVATRVTDAPEGVTAFRWSPDGASFAFVSPDPPNRSGVERYNRSFEIGDNDYLITEAPVSSHLWIGPAAGGEAIRLTSGLESVLGFEWQPDGQSIAFVSQPRPQHAEFLNASVNLIEPGSRARRVLVQAPVAGERAAVARVWKSPPGADFVLYGRPRGKERDYGPLAIYSIPRAGGAARNLAATLDLDLYREPAWMPDGKSMVVTGTEGTRATLWLQPLDGPPRRLQTGSLSQVELLVGSRTGALAFIGSDSRNAPELYFMATPQAAPRKLTTFNQHITALRLGKVETLTWHSDNFTPSGVVTYPPDFEPGRKYPLVLVVHGGPMGVSTEPLGDFEGLFAQLLAAKGWLVFRPNYRGSGGGGAAFQLAIVNDAGEGPARDVMSGVALLQSRGIVDSSRMAVSGWSYGGFMTVWLAAHYPVWTAAVAGAAVTDWFDAYDLSDENVWNAQARGGSPWVGTNSQRYWEQSPIAYARQIRAPTLILANTGDQRVPITQSYKLYHALKDNGVPTSFVVYPVAGHWPEDPVHQRDLYRRWTNWIEQNFNSAGAVH